MPPVLQRLFAKGIRMHFTLRRRRAPGESRDRAQRRGASRRRRSTVRRFVYAYGGEAVGDLDD